MDTTPNISYGRGYSVSLSALQSFYSSQHGDKMKFFLILLRGMDECSITMLIK